MSGVCDGNYFLSYYQVLSVCQVHAHYCCFHRQCVVMCSCLFSSYCLHSELVELQPCEPFLSLSFSLIYS